MFSVIRARIVRTFYYGDRHGTSATQQQRRCHTSHRDRPSRPIAHAPRRPGPGKRLGQRHANRLLQALESLRRLVLRQRIPGPAGTRGHHLRVPHRAGRHRNESRHSQTRPRRDQALPRGRGADLSHHQPPGQKDPQGPRPRIPAPTQPSRPTGPGRFRRHLRSSRHTQG